MAHTFSKKRQNHYHILFTVIIIFIICTIFLALISSFHSEAENEAYEMLQLQTEQIKDDLALQIKSDNENLITMANFAAKLYARGEDYSLMFDSFKPIGLFSRIGILTPDGMFTTKEETVDLSGKISFGQAVADGRHITGRTYSYSAPEEEVIRSAVPIEVDGQTVAIIYGIIKISTINEKYNDLVRNLDAKLFVYDKLTGKFIVDTANLPSGQLSDLQTRKFNDGYSYEQLTKRTEGFSSFNSIYADEDLYVYYTTIADLNWGIMLMRYATQVFENTQQIMESLMFAIACMCVTVAVYLYITIYTERKRTKIATASADIRRLLLAVNKKNKNIDEALEKVKLFLASRSAFFIDTDGVDYNNGLSNQDNTILSGNDRTYLIGELFRYAARIKAENDDAIRYMRIVPNEHLSQTNQKLYAFLTGHHIREIAFAIISEENNHTSILGITNAAKKALTKALLEDIAICFSIAVYNNKNLNRTEIVATTDALTGALNRVSYKKDILQFNTEKPRDFSCIYIDANELNLINNKYGHAAGDEMLIYIANSLKEVFFGHCIYRMGGDEFLVFTKGVEQARIKEKTDIFLNRLKPKGYSVSIGISYRTQSGDCEEMVREAEVMMYETKAQYYQNKEDHAALLAEEDVHDAGNTGNKETDLVTFILKEHYYGLYKVSLETDTVHRVLTSTYLGYKEKEKQFSKLLLNYINDVVHPDYRRTVMSFLYFDVIKRQLADGTTPSATFKKLTGETVKLSIYRLHDEKVNETSTLWVFAKDNA